MSFAIPVRRVHIIILLALGLLLSGCQALPEPGLSAKQIAVLQQHGFSPVEAGWELGMSQKVLFGFAEHEVSSDSRSFISKLARALQDVDLHDIRIDGHTDNIGEQAYNKALSLRRAETVAAIFVENGMQKDKVLVRGLGDSMPVADNRTRKGRSQNRRVSIIITSH